MSIVHTLRRAALLQEKIEALRAQLTGLLDRARAEIAASAKDEPALPLRRARRPKQVAASKGPRRSPLAGRKRASSPSGPLAPAVVQVLRSKGRAMNVRDILAALRSGGYKFTSPEPRKNLAARIYRLSGVRQVAPGLFNVV